MKKTGEKREVAAHYVTFSHVYSLFCLVNFLVSNFLALLLKILSAPAYSRMGITALMEQRYGGMTQMQSIGSHLGDTKFAMW